MTSSIEDRITHDPQDPNLMYTLRVKFSEDQIGKAVVKMNKYLKNIGRPTVDYKEVHGDPCSSCGSNNLIKTGVCHVCALCGTSQGCS